MSIFLRIFGVMALGGGWVLPLPAADADIPLAVTTLAHPSLRVTPTDAERELSDRYLQNGLLFLKKNNPERAIQEFKDAVRIAPSAANYKALGTAYYQAGDKLKGAWAYRESLQLEPDPKVQALVDALEGKDHPEETFQSKNDELRHARLLEMARADAKAGRRDRALRGYLEAYALHPAADSAGPGARLAADLVEEALAAGALDKAIVTLSQAQPLREAKNLDAAGLAALGRLAKAEDRVVAATGAKLRDHQKALLSDREAWERALQEKMAGKVKEVNLNFGGR
jgi:tetratricopeptide (TPR) repeat protein